MNLKALIVPLLIALFSGSSIWAQKTQIRGFANVDVRYTGQEDNLIFFLGEQDLFITSQITDRISFLGESVFKYSPNSPTKFNVSMERLILSYNIVGNHNILIGKHHTPFSYWNDTYHHGRVFFPTVDRPLLFRQGLIEIHTTGVALQGLNLGNQNFGYQVMVGNGIGANDFSDDNKFKSVTIDLHAKPVKGMKFGLTGYMDKFSSDAKGHHGEIIHDDTTVIELAPVDIFQVSGGAYFRYFKNKVEVLTEVHGVFNDADSVEIGSTQNYSAYAYFGYRVSDKIVPYIKYDITSMDQKEIFYQSQSQQLLSFGLRYEFSYLAIVKLEYNRSMIEGQSGRNGVYFQFAVGF